MYNFIQHFKDYLRLREAVRTADEHHAQDGERYYVMPSQDGKLIIMDRKNFRLMKRKHYIAHDVTTQNLRQQCFYHTPYANGTDAMPAFERKRRAEEYYHWITTWRKLEKMKKNNAKWNKKGTKA